MVSTYVRRHLEDYWRKKVQRAQKDYQAATADYRMLLATQPAGPTGVGVTDSYLTRARRAESEALAEYTRVLRIFSELTLHGRMPPEESERIGFYRCRFAADVSDAKGTAAGGSGEHADQERVRTAVLRKTLQGKHVFHAGDLTVDLHARSVEIDHHKIQLTATEFELLKPLVQNAGRLLTQRRLTHEVWGEDPDPESSQLMPTTIDGKAYSEEVIGLRSFFFHHRDYFPSFGVDR
jgi:hypothetical protein